MRIIIADDDPAFRHLLEEIVVKWGYDVAVCRDGNEAWQALKTENAPRIAILDRMMPGIDGVELCRKVRKEHPGPYTYIILLTAQQRDEDLVTGMEAGADDYITKPLKTNELRVRLNAGKRLIELQNELMISNTELEAFNFTIAHDLRIPLSLIKSYCDVIQQHCGHKLDAQCKKYLQETYNNTARMNGLIGTLLNFSRLNRVEIRKQPVDLTALAKTVATELNLLEPERKVTLRIAEGIRAEGDEILLRVVMDNLIGNAWKFTSKREVAEIEFGETSAGGKPACFVRDNGIGFDMIHAHRLFNPLQRLPGSDEYGGLGIGLVSVERIIRRHGGKVWGTGEPGKGATFYFSI